MERDALSLDHLRTFAVVAEHGSFSAAARRLHRAQSAITYAVQRLEAEVGVSLFARDAYRPVLSEAGRALLPQARRVLAEADGFRAQARALAGGLEPELGLVVDAMFPMPVLVAALGDFQARFPSVRTRLRVEALGQALATLIDGTADIGVLLAAETRTDALVRHACRPIELVPVAAPSHPLADAADAASASRDHLQLVLSDRAGGGGAGNGDPDKGVTGSRTWRLADLGAKHALLLAGLGWGSMPLHMVADDLEAGRLVALAFDEWDGFTLPVRIRTAVCHRADRVLGPAGAWLLERLRARSTDA